MTLIPLMKPSVQETFNINPQPHYFLKYRLLDFDQTKYIIQNIKTVKRSAKQETFFMCQLCNVHCTRIL